MIKKYSIEMKALRALAQSKGGDLLTRHYVNVFTLMEWCCSLGHTWKATANKIKNQGTWCPKCAHNCPDTLETMQRIAVERGGLCVSTEYVNQSTKLRWRCGTGHQWEALPRNVKNLGHWCPYCAGQKVWAPGQSQEASRIAELRDVAAHRNGQCLSTSYRRASDKFLWQCERGHTWAASANNIKQGRWCPFCAGLRIWAPGRTESEARLARLRDVAEARGGFCLADRYEGTDVKVLWECAQGHQWTARPSHIIHIRSWCPECARQTSGYRRPNQRV